MAAQAIGSENGIGRMDVSVTFPEVFAMRMRGRPEAYFGSAAAHNEHLPAGNDLQAQWHEQKRKDAHAMANAKVQSTHMMNKRANVSHAGYYDMPKPVLGQRKFANGNEMFYGSYSSARRDQEGPWRIVENGSGDGAGLVGGVLRSAEGQAYARKILDARIAQFDAINAAKGSFLSDSPVTVPAVTSAAQAETADTVGEATRVELNLLLQTIMDALADGQGGEIKLTRFTSADAQRVLTIVFRIAPTADGDYLAQIYGQVQQVVADLQEVLVEDGEYEQDATSKATAMTLLDLFGEKKLLAYLKQMIAAVNNSAADRLALSKSLVISLGFAKPQSNMSVLAQQNTVDDRSNARFTNPSEDREDTEHGEPPADDDDDDDDHDRPDQGYRRADPRSGFDFDERDEFGYQSGRYINQDRGNAAFFGEDAPDLAAGEGPRHDAAQRDVRSVRGDIATRGEIAERRRPPQPPPSVVSNLRSEFSRDQQAFQTPPSVAETPAPRAGVPVRELLAPRGDAGLPKTAADLRKYNTMEALRELADQMTAAGTPYRIRATTTNIAHVRKVIAKKLGIKGRM